MRLPSADTFSSRLFATAPTGGCPPWMEVNLHRRATLAEVSVYGTALGDADRSAKEGRLYAHGDCRSEARRASPVSSLSVPPRTTARSAGADGVATRVFRARHGCGTCEGANRSKVGLSCEGTPPRHCRPDIMNSTFVASHPMNRCPNKE
jgi:hypothetical protein